MIQYMLAIEFLVSLVPKIVPPQSVVTKEEIKIGGLPCWSSGEESTCQCSLHGFDPWSRKIPHAAEQQSPCGATTDPVLESPWAPANEVCLPRVCTLQQEEPLQ